MKLFTIFGGCDGYLWAKIKERTKKVGQHQTLISFYWHHDSLNLFINFGCVPSLSEHTHTNIHAWEQKQRGEWRFVTFFYIVILWPAKNKTKKSWNKTKNRVHKNTSTSHKPWTVVKLYVPRQKNILRRKWEEREKTKSFNKNSIQHFSMRPFSHNV